MGAIVSSAAVGVKLISSMLRLVWSLLLDV
jgi:hypothetical protein